MLDTTSPRLQRYSADQTDGAFNKNGSYQPSCTDWLRTLFIPLAYFMLMAVAVAYAVYIIMSLLHSYLHPVQYSNYHTTSCYPAIGIAIIPDFSNFLDCEYRYYDDYSPNPVVPTRQCEYFNISFTSKLSNTTRHAMVFKGPTNVTQRQSLGVHFTINTTQREFNAIEYFAFYQWSSIINKSLDEQRLILSDFEDRNTLFRFPAGFKTWVEMSYIEQHGVKGKSIEFGMEISLAKYQHSTYNNSTDLDACTVYFEWASSQYVFIEEMMSTSIWTSLGAMCGVFMMLLKAAESLKAWIRWIRAEREKRKGYFSLI